MSFAKPALFALLVIGLNLFGYALFSGDQNKTNRVVASIPYGGEITER